MIIDCDGCVMRDVACGDCVVTFLVGPPAGLGTAEQVALAILADGGLVPPLRMAAPPGGAPVAPPGRAPVAPPGRAPAAPPARVRPASSDAASA